MKRIFVESGFRFDFSDRVLNACVADKPSYNGLSAVDFIVETAEHFLFIEVKNPDHPEAMHHTERNDFLRDEKSFCQKMVGKLKDSLLKELAMGRRFSKSIVYILLIEFDRFDAAQRRRIFEHIEGNMPSFKEAPFLSVKGIRFAVCNKSEFQSAYREFCLVEDVYDTA